MVFGLLSRKYVQPAEAIVKIGGEEASDLYPFISEIKVNASRHKFAEATITLESPADENGYWSVADDDRLQSWTDISIEADFQDGSEEIMRGVIYNPAGEYPIDAGRASFTLTCRDSAAKLSREERIVRWGEPPVGTTDLAIVSALASEHGLTTDPLNDPGATGLILSQKGTDIEFLRQRACANGFELIFSEGAIYFGPMRVDLEPQDAIMVYAGHKTNCRTFNPANRGERRRVVGFAQRDEHGNPGGVSTVTSDLSQMGTTPAQGSGTGLGETVELLDQQTVPDGAQTEAYAQGMANEGDMSLRATGELDGTLYGNVLKVGLPVNVDGTGQRHDGPYYVDEVTHQFDINGYRQGFTLLRNAYGDPEAGLPGNPLAGVL
ncbi:MAG: hypothetical protein AAF441_08675 [Pseudomonadota bacterium]